MPAADDEAVGWIIRLRDAPVEDWQSFTFWLERDAEHAAAYERLAAIDADAADRMRTRPTSDREISAELKHAKSAADRLAPGSQSRWRYWMSGLSAGLAVAGGGIAVLTAMPATYAVTTAPGETRSVALADGTRIELAGDSRVLLDRRDPRKAELASGEALFTVVHDPRHGFEVRVGTARIEDLGTVFDVSRRGAATEVSVASGAVRYKPEGDALRLGAGDRLRDPDGTAVPSRSHIEPADVAEWREARLSFNGRCLAEVAAQIYATSGLPLRVSPVIADRAFTGVIVVAGGREALMRRLQPLLDVSAVRQGAGWLLIPASATR